MFHRNRPTVGWRERNAELSGSFVFGTKIMLRDVISSIDYSFAAEIALGLFVVAFAIMIYGTLRLSRRTTDRFASIPLSDRVEDPRDGR